MDNPTAARYCRHCGKPLPAGPVDSLTTVTPLMKLWRTLKRDLTRAEVKTILGEPLRIDLPHSAYDAVPETWTYEYAPTGGSAGHGVPSVLRFAPDDGRLLSWTEPDWKSLGAEGLPPRGFEPLSPA